jgi:hypothetical protein
VDDFALTPAERALFEALNRREVRYLLLGMGAALLEGAPVATQDLDVWFEDRTDARIEEAARDAGGFGISGFGKQPPGFGGATLRVLSLERLIASKRATGRPKDTAQLPVLEATLRAREGRP